MIRPQCLIHGCIYSQGLFLKRQPEVSAEFADCMTEKLLASETLWAAVLTGSKADKFAEILRGRMRTFMRGTAAVLYGGSDPTEFAGAEWWGALEARVSERTMQLLPSELPRVHGYVDTALGLREDLNVNLRRLSPAEFEQASRRMCPMPLSMSTNASFITWRRHPTGAPSGLRGGGAHPHPRRRSTRPCRRLGAGVVGCAE